MNNFTKYKMLLKKEIRQQTKVDFYSEGFNYNSTRRDLWTEKLNSTHKELDDLTDNLTPDEKIKILTLLDIQI